MARATKTNQGYKFKHKKFRTIKTTKKKLRIKLQKIIKKIKIDKATTKI